MDKKNSKIKLLIFLLILLVIAIIAIVYCNNNKTDELQDNSNINNVDNSVSFIVVNVEDTSSTEGLAYKSREITDKEKIDSLMQIINSAEEYDPKSFIPDLGDIPPTVTIYLSNGDKYMIAACDQMDDDGNIVNLMTKWDTQDGSNKTFYKVDVRLAEFIQNLYNN